VLGLICCAPVGLILGFVGIKRTKDGQRKGRGLAIAGIVLGLLGLLAWVGIGIAAVAGIAWFDSVLLPEEAEAGQCINVDDDDNDAVILYEKECNEEHDGEVVYVGEYSEIEDSVESLGGLYANACIDVMRANAPDDLAAVEAALGGGLDAWGVVVEDPEKFGEGDDFICYVEPGDKLDEPIL
jgi:hypothetical protein